MRTAIFSDIHSNLEALQTAIDDVTGKNVDTIYCTGDLVGYAANPNEVIDLVKAHKISSVMGNHDFACADQRAAANLVKNA